jgi:lantibiotic modifying enzyme
MGAGLGSGYTGVALFLAQLGALTGMARYTDLAWKAVRPLPRLLRALADGPAVVGCGAFLGIGGICYGLARLAALLGDPVLTEWLAAALPLMAVADDGQPDLAGGRAGGLAAMLAVAEETGSAEAGAVATVLAERLVADDSIGGRGFLTGRAGAGWALSRYAAAGGDTRCAERGRALVAADWRDAGPEPGWCTGLSGLLLAGAGYEIVEQRVPSLAERPALCDLSLCHGELGVLEPLVVRASRGDAECAAMVRQGSGVVLGGLDRFGPRCGTPCGVSCPGLLTGLAGIGYGLLRLGMPDQVPSVLLLETDRRKEDRHDN